MKKTILLSFVCFVMCLESQAQALTKIYVLRHANKAANGVDNLNALGFTRAIDLKRYLAPTGINALFSTNFVRTRRTLQPMATALMPVRIYSDVPTLITNIRSTLPGRRIVVVGHSNTVPQIITGCGCASPFPAAGIPESQFDNLLLILVRWTPAGVPTCELLPMKYGESTP
jgi:2,3-bisphosphoglycerate-dependent phosphoglycerate mutase